MAKPPIKYVYDRTTHGIRLIHGRVRLIHGRVRLIHGRLRLILVE